MLQRDLGGVSVRLSHAPNASKLMIAGLCGFHRRTDEHPIYTPHGYGTPLPLPLDGHAPLTNAYHWAE